MPPLESHSFLDSIVKPIYKNTTPLSQFIGHELIQPINQTITATHQEHHGYNQQGG